MIDFIKSDVFEINVTADAVYADPPYKGQGKRYGIKNNINIAQLIKLMEHIAPRRALSISVPMLRETMDLLPTARVLPWVKPQTSFKPNVWPAYTWEPVLVWGDIKADRTMPTPRDHIVAAAHQKKPGEFVTPKPPDFADWIIRVLLPRPADKIFCDLFSGSGAIGRVADGLGCKVIAVDKFISL
jgi:hypothetical protein